MNFGENKKWKGYFTKNDLYISNLTKLKDRYKYALCVDARDILFMRGLDSILKNYNEYFLDKLVFNGEDTNETGASYDKVMGSSRNNFINHRMDLPYTSTNKYKYLNSGAFIGPIDLIIETLTEAYKYKEKHGGSVDQGPIEEVYLSNTENICVDEKCKIFQVLSENNSGGVNFDVIYKKGKPYNRLTNSAPSVIHGPGHALMVQQWRMITDTYY